MSNHIIKNRFGIYYYRITTQLDIQKLIPSIKKDVRISLHTRSIRLARDAAAVYHTEISNFFSSIRQMSEDNDKKKYSKSRDAICRTSEDEYLDNLVRMSKSSGFLKKFFHAFQQEFDRKVTIRSFELDTIDKINKFFEVVEQVGKYDDKVSNFLPEISVKPQKARNAEDTITEKSVAFRSVRKIEKNNPSDESIQQIKRFEQGQYGQAMAYITRQNFLKNEATFIVSTASNDILIDGLKTDCTEEDDNALSLILEPHFSQLQLAIDAPRPTNSAPLNTDFVPRR